MTATHASFGLAISLIALCTVVAVYDVVAVYTLGPGTTVSYLFSQWSQRFPVFPLVFGVLIGHLFWPLQPPIPYIPKE